MMTTKMTIKMKTKTTNKKSDGRPLFSGVVTALVTPFKKGAVDFTSLKKLVEHQLNHGIEGFVVNGTTGESPTLEAVEVEKIFRFVRKVSDGVVPLLLGTGSNSTKETIKKTAMAKKLGADGALVVVPYYNKPPQRGLIEHYKAVAQSSKVPIVLYNVPGRTVVSMTPETIVTLSKVKNIVGVKEASGDLRTLGVLTAEVSKNFLLSSGDDSSAIDFNSIGGHGVVSVVSHVIPAEMVGLVKRAQDRDEAAIERYKKYNEINRLMGVEANPIPVKMALHLMGIIASPELRLPLITLSDANKKILSQELEALGLLK